VEGQPSADLHADPPTHQRACGRSDVNGAPCTDQRTHDCADARANFNTDLCCSRN